MTTLIGIDYGTKKIGFAIGQTITGTANPIAVIMQNNDMWNKIDKIFKDWKPNAVIIGEPILADGKPHPLEKAIEVFIITLKTSYNINVYRENEAYSSTEASSRIKNKSKKQPIDAYAAAVFLQSWMQENTI